jgi:hypothetical protein
VVVALWLMVGLGLVPGVASGLHRWGDAVADDEPVAAGARPVCPDIEFEQRADAYLRGRATATKPAVATPRWVLDLVLQRHIY